LFSALFAGRRHARRQDLPYRCGVICFTALGPASLFDQPRDQIRELQEISRAKERAAFADDGLRIPCDDVSPLRWHRANVVLVDSQQKPGSVAVVAFTNADELPSAERVKRVGDAHKARA
jgi:hypothetical protein